MGVRSRALTFSAFALVTSAASGSASTRVAQARDASAVARSQRKSMASWEKWRLDSSGGSVTPRANCRATSLATNHSVTDR